MQEIHFNPLILSTHTHTVSVSRLVCMLVCEDLSSGGVKAEFERGLAATVKGYVL